MIAAPDRRILSAFSRLGSSGLLLIEGDPGSGRTTLLKRLHSLQPKAPIVRADVFSKAESYSLLNLVVALRPKVSSELRGALFVDDLHWADPESIRTLIAAVRTGQLAVAATWHTALADPTVATTIEGAADERIRLELLPWDAAVEWLVDRRPDLPSAVREAIARLAEGNPQLLATLADSSTPDGLGALEPSSIPHLRLTAPEERRILDVLALTPDPLTPEVIAGVLGADDGVVLEQLRRLENIGLLESTLAGFTLRHEVVTRTVRQGMSDGVRSAMHRRLARELMSIGAPSLTIGRQLLAGGADDPPTVEWLRAAASSALTRAPKEAVELIHAARALASRRGEPTDDLVGDEVHALIAAGRPVDAEALVRANLATLPSTDARSDLTAALSDALWLEDRITESVALLEGASQRRTSKREANLLLAERSLRHVLSGELDVGGAEAEQARRGGRQMADPLSQSFACSALAHLSYYGARFAEAADLASEAVALADNAGVETARRRTRYELGMFSLHADRVDTAIDVFRAEQAIGELMEAAWHRPIYCFGLGLAGYHIGDWRSAKEQLQKGLKLVDQGGTQWESTFARATLAAMLVHQGELTAGREILASAPVAERNTPHHSEDALLWAQALTDEAGGDLAAALDKLNRAFELVADFHVPARLRWLVPDLVRVALATGAIDRAREASGALGEVAERSQVAYVTGAALRCRGVVEEDPSAVMAAVQAMRASPRRTELGFTCEDAGALLLRLGNLGDAVPLLEEALQIYIDLDATALSARVRGRLRTAGIRHPVTRRTRPATGWDSLTPAEQRVVRLVAEGLTNSEVARRLFVSPRTVETHLTHVFGKLGLSSRVEVVAAVAAQTAP